MSDERIKVKKLPLNETTDQGAYWCEVDGEKIGENGRPFWETESEAFACGRRWLLREAN